MEAYLAGLTERLADPNGRGGDERQRAILMLAAAVGGLMLARASAGSSPAVSAEILQTVRDQLRSVAKV
jgi:hypothetical protein